MLAPTLRRIAAWVLVLFNRQCQTWRILMDGFHKRRQIPGFIFRRVLEHNWLSENVVLCCRPSR